MIKLILLQRPYVGKTRKDIKEHMLSFQAEIKKDEIPLDWSPQAADLFNQVIIILCIFCVYFVCCGL